MTAHAIIVGIDSYAKAKWNRTSAVADALRFHTWATTKGGVDPAQVRLLLARRDHPADFFSVEVLTLPGLVRYLVLFGIDLQTRRVQIGGVVRQAYGVWMTQVARNLTDGVDGFGVGCERGRCR
jgi:hypothetical protein